MYSNCCCSCSFEPEIIKIGQSSQKIYSNNILNFQESTTILNACTKKSGNLSYAPCNLHTIVLFQVFLYNNNYIVSSNYSFNNNHFFLHTVIWFKETNNNP